MELNKIYNQDCMEVTAKYPDKFFELAIVDPPYGIGDTWSKNRNDRFYQSGKLHIYQNEVAPGEEYFKELSRVSKNQIVWGGNYFTDNLPPTNSWVIWHKHSNADLIKMSEAEMAWTSFKKVAKVVKMNWSGAVKCEITTKIHPHQKPVMLYKWLLSRYAKPGDKILDTHAGSCSLPVACIDMGFDFVACEIDPDYWKAGLQRVIDFKAQIKIPF